MADVARRLNRPVPVQVEVDAARQPRRVLARGRRWLDVEQVLEAWQIDDRWWTDEPVRRCYFSLQTSNGSVVTVYYDVAAKAWHEHRA